MSKFNKVKPRAVKTAQYSVSLAARPDATVNQAGGLAFSYTDKKMELFTMVMSCLFNEPKFYGKTGATETRILSLIDEISAVDPAFLLHLAKYARHEGNLRSLPIVMLVETAVRVRDANRNLPQSQKTTLKSLVRPFVPQIVSRADEITEALAYYQGKFSELKHFPLSLRRGLADAFKNFSAYQLLKYDREGDVTLGDALNVLHPSSALNRLTDAETKTLYKHLRKWDFEQDKDAEVINKLDSKQSILSKTSIDAEVLEAVNKGDITWEVFISHFGSTTESWEAIAPNMPYMATLRNINNFLKNGVSESTLKRVAEKLCNEKAVEKSKQFPYRFFSAVNEISKGDVRVPGYIVKAISSAMEISVKNLPKLGGVTAIFSDNSGSMHNTASAKSTVQMIDIAGLMSAIAYSFSDDAMVGVFGQSFKFVTLNPSDSILTNMQKISKTDVGHSTEAHLSINALTTKKIKVDRIFIFSDMQCYDGGSSRGYYYGGNRSLAAELKTYRNTVNPNVKVYSYDLQGYGTAQFPSTDTNVVTLAGYSDKIFKFMEIFEAKDKSILDIIANY